jgi:hypothetical protein
MLSGIRVSGNRRRFAAAARLLALAMALDAFASMRARVEAAPADIFDVGAPAIGSEPPKAADIKEGDASVSTQTGQFSYSVPIPAPPGRNGRVWISS